MPLNANTLASAIKTEILARPAAGGVDGPALDALCAAIATAVVAHITSNAVVSGTATGAMGGGAGVPVTGTVG